MLFFELLNPYIRVKQEHSDLNWEFEVWSFLFCQLNYTLFYIFYVIPYITTGGTTTCILVFISRPGILLAIFINNSCTWFSWSWFKTSHIWVK